MKTREKIRIISDHPGAAERELQQLYDDQEIDVQEVHLSSAAVSDGAHLKKVVTILVIYVDA